MPSAQLCNGICSSDEHDVVDNDGDDDKLIEVLAYRIKVDGGCVSKRCGKFGYVIDN